MKTAVTKIAITCLTTCSLLTAQVQKEKASIALLSIDSKSIGMEPKNAGNLVRLELEKLNIYDVKDKYDVQDFMAKNELNMPNCFGKSCLTEVGILLKSDKMFSGSIEHIGKSIIITFRILDVKTGSFEKTYVHEFLYIPEEIQNMVKLSILEMFELPFDIDLMNKLSKPYAFDNSNNNPEITRLRLDGPRMGFTSYSGQLRNRMTESKSKGGFDAYPVMFQFGYQFEKQYLNEGKIQALFEFIPMITGLDQGYFIPSITLLHGIRSNIHGWEFAFGPTFNLIPMSSGYYDENNNWKLKTEWNNDQTNTGKTNPYEIVERLDSRGTLSLHSGFVLAAGRTFKSGKLNMPVNAFVIPGKDGWRFGLSVGFNAKN